MTTSERYFNLLSERGYWWATDLSDRLLVMGNGAEVWGDAIRGNLGDAMSDEVASLVDFAECERCEEFSPRDDMVDMAPEHLPAHLICQDCR